jgi:hypothetical protein
MPFAPTQSIREQSGDPRRSLEERYAAKEVYVELVTKAAEALIAAGYLLPADLDGLCNAILRLYNLCTGKLSVWHTTDTTLHTLPVCVTFSDLLTGDERAH